MKDTLKPGLSFEFDYRVPEDKTVPNLFPEASELKVMPEVLATGFMVGLVEWACIDALKPHLDWPSEQTVGIHVNLSHTAPTPPGFTVTIKGTLKEVDGRKLTFEVTAHDGVDRISAGVHQRFIIDAGKFNANVEAKAQKR